VVAKTYNPSTQKAFRIASLRLVWATYTIKLCLKKKKKERGVGKEDRKKILSRHGSASL
jgi:hypothetical protein